MKNDFLLFVLGLMLTIDMCGAAGQVQGAIDKNTAEVHDLVQAIKELKYSTNGTETVHTAPVIYYPPEASKNDRPRRIMEAQVRAESMMAIKHAY